MNFSQVIKKTSSGSTKFVDTIYFEINDAKSYASYVLLKNYYFKLDIDNPYRKRKNLIEFSRTYLTNVLNNTGDLVCTYCFKNNLIIELEGMKVPHNTKATIDHIIPISKGGNVFDETNICVACSKCNSKKGNKSIEEFKQNIMKPYTNKTDKVDDRKCLFGEIVANNKARKTAVRREAKKEISVQLTNIHFNMFTEPKITDSNSWWTGEDRIMTFASFQDAHKYWASLPKFGTKEFNNMCSELFGGKPKTNTHLEELKAIRNRFKTALDNKDLLDIGFCINDIDTLITKMNKNE